MDSINHIMNKNLPFTSKTKMADVIHRDYTLIPIISRFGIEFGFGNKTISEVCHNYNINMWFFLEMINSFHNPDYFPKKQLQNFSAKNIIYYLTNTHKYYLENKIPEIQGYIDGMEQGVLDENLKNVKLLNDFFKEYSTELTRHLDKEESEVFPYVLNLEQMVENKIYDQGMYRTIQDESIEEYERSHESLEIKLSDLKNLIIKFLPSVLCKTLCQQLLTELFRLEDDLENHSRIEDKVLVPKVKLLEQKYMELNGGK